MRAKDVGNPRKDDIARRVSAAVVDILEAVDAEGDDNTAPTCRRALANYALNLLFDLPPVGQRGQRIVGCEVLEVGARAPQCVPRPVERVGRPPDLVLHRIETQRHRADLVAARHRNGRHNGSRVCVRQIAAAEGVHGPGEVGKRPDR